MRGPGFVGRTVATGVAGVALTGALVLPGAAAQASNTFVEVTPNTVQAGERVSIRANCDDGNNRQGNVHSDAFGRVILRPDNGFLTGAATVPGSRPPGQYAVNLKCQNGNTATTNLTVVNMSKPSQGPATGAGGTAGGLSPTVLAGGIAAVALGAGLALFGLRRRRPELGP